MKSDGKSKSKSNPLFQQRETINREIKVLEAQVKGIKDELPANTTVNTGGSRRFKNIYLRLLKPKKITAR